MNRAQIEVLLKSIYRPEGSQKFISDLDKISASGQKVAGSLRMAKKEAAEVFSGVSASTRARNPHLFGPNVPSGTSAPSGGGSGVPPIISPPTTPPSPNQSNPAPSGGKGGGQVGIFQQFINRVLSRALSITAGLLVYKALNVPLQALTKTIKGLNDAIENARKLYASALTSGLGLQFTTKRNLLASVLGVSEKDVFQFGQAILFLNGQLEHASYNLAKTTPRLAGLSFQFKILEKDLSSIFATLVNESAPALSTFADGLAKFLVAFDKFLTNDPIAKFIIKLNFLGLQGLGKLLGGEDKGAAPEPVAYMKQIHASALEHMGLIIGGLGGASDFAAQTAQNTKKTAEAVTKIAQKMVGGGSGIQPFGEFNSMP